MLESIVQAPEAGQALTWGERRRNIIALIIQFSVNFVLYKVVTFVLFDLLNWSIQKSVFIFTVYTAVTTVLLYFYALRLTKKTKKIDKKTN